MMASNPAVPRLPAAALEALAERICAAIGREYPNKIAHALCSDADVAPPRRLTPAFFGCYDWHSAVHGHWTLARLCRTAPNASFVSAARAVLDTSLTREKLDAELAYLSHPDRTGFELPYGIGWLLTLQRELAEWDDDDARRWGVCLQPLAELGTERMQRYVERLPFPVRSGEHSQTAFGVSLFLDFATGPARDSVARRVRQLYGDDRDGALHLEPSGYDFLSPCLGEADLLRRVLPPGEFASWLTRFLPVLPRDGDGGWLEPVRCPDRCDGKLVHLDGLNASRAWMLHGIARGLPRDDPRRAGLAAAAAAHEAAALAALDNEHYAAAHWLGTFAVYLTTLRGL